MNPPLGLEAHKGHWVVAMELKIAGLDTIHIETINPMALLELPDATAPTPATDALTTMRLSTGGKQLTAGHHVLSTFDTTITASRVLGPALQEMSIGSGFAEQIDVKAIGLHIRITSSKANKFVDEVQSPAFSCRTHLSLPIARANPTRFTHSMLSPPSRRCGAVLSSAPF